jgi:hypothetical protein
MSLLFCKIYIGSEISSVSYLIGLKVEEGRTYAFVVKTLVTSISAFEALLLDSLR